MAPTILPDGYKILSVLTEDETKVITYTDKNDGVLTFKQSTPEETGTIDTEDADVKDVKINEFDGIFAVDEEGSRLLWRTEDFVFYMSTTDLNIDLIPIAESVSIN